LAHLYDSIVFLCLQTQKVYLKQNIIVTVRMGRKVHSKLLFTSSANTDGYGFYTFYISQGSAATQLRCGGMFGNHFTTNFSQNVPLEKDEKKSLEIGQYLAKIWTKLCGLLFGPPCITPQKPRTLLKDMSKPT